MIAHSALLSVEFQDVVADILRNTCSSRDLRADFDPSIAPSRARWRQLAEAGVTGASVSETFGGLGLQPSDLILVAEEAGYFALPEPLVETLFVVVPMLERFASPELQERWLPGIVSGEVMATVQLPGVPAAAFGQYADLALVGTRNELAFVELAAAKVHPLTSTDPARRPGLIEIEQEPTPAYRLPPESSAIILARGTIATAAVLNGVSRRLLALSVQYVSTRKQFGVPVGSFQAVKHLLADVALVLETARPAAWSAAEAIERSDEPPTIAASVAKLAANLAASQASYAALQVHGGIGFTWEHDLHIWMNRGKVLEEQWGSAQAHRRVLGAALASSPDPVETFGPQLES